MDKLSSSPLAIPGQLSSRERSSMFVQKFARCLVVLAVACWGSAGIGQDVKVLTNHIGYETGGPKRAVILGHAADSVTAFRLIDTSTGKTVLSGDTQKAGPVDEWKDWIFWTAEFSGLQTDGTFVLECTTNGGNVRSFPFLVAAQSARAQHAVQRRLLLQRPALLRPARQGRHESEVRRQRPTRPMFTAAGSMPRAITASISRIFRSPRTSIRSKFR